ncbi:MAG: DotU family type IV/VI secretion system protein [Gemmatimonadaceae bacterium]
MTSPGPIQPPRAEQDAPAAPGRRGQLAMAMQEILTATARLRSGKQVAADAESFRAQLRQLVAAAQQEARRGGYPDDDVNLALFAVVAFVDESVLNSPHPMFAEWSRRPLQEELFSTNRAGDLFFDYARQALERRDGANPAAVADLLEVFALCLLLGFRGRFSHAPAEAQPVADRLLARIARSRGAAWPLAPHWPPSAEVVRPNVRDPWLRRLAILAAAAFVFSAGLWVAFRVSLSHGARDLRALPTAQRADAAPSR